MNQDNSRFLSAEEIKAKTILSQAKDTIDEWQNQINQLQPDKFRVREYRPKGSKTSRPPGTQSKEQAELKLQQEEKIKETKIEIEKLKQGASDAIKETLSKQMKEWEAEINNSRINKDVEKEPKQATSVASKFIAGLNYSKLFNHNEEDLRETSSDRSLDK